MCSSSCFTKIRLHDNGRSPRYLGSSVDQPINMLSFKSHIYEPGQACVPGSAQPLPFGSSFCTVANAPAGAGAVLLSLVYVLNHSLGMI